MTEYYAWEWPLQQITVKPEHDMKNSYLKTTREWRETVWRGVHTQEEIVQRKFPIFAAYNLAADKAVGTLCWWTITVQVLSQGNWSHWRKRWEPQKGRGSNHQVLSARISAQALDHKCVVQIQATQLKTENLNWDWSCCPVSVVCTDWNTDPHSERLTQDTRTRTHRHTHTHIDTHTHTQTHRHI